MGTRDKTGEQCPVVGGLSMDAMTVRVPGQLDPGEIFTIIHADFSPMSISELSDRLDTIPDETFSILSPRLPRLYKSHLYEEAKVTPSLYVTDDERVSILKGRLKNVDF